MPQIAELITMPPRPETDPLIATDAAFVREALEVNNGFAGIDPGRVIGAIAKAAGLPRERVIAVLAEAKTNDELGIRATRGRVPPNSGGVSGFTIEAASKNGPRISEVPAGTDPTKGAWVDTRGTRRAPITRLQWEQWGKER